MRSTRYANEFKVETVWQVTDRGHRVSDVASRLGVTTHSLNAWKRRQSKVNPEAHSQVFAYSIEVRLDSVGGHRSTLQGRYHVP